MSKVTVSLGWVSRPWNSQPAQKEGPAEFREWGVSRALGATSWLRLRAGLGWLQQPVLLSARRHQPGPRSLPRQPAGNPGSSGFPGRGQVPDAKCKLEALALGMPGCRHPGEAAQEAGSLVQTRASLPSSSPQAGPATQFVGPRAK